MTQFTPVPGPLSGRGGIHLEHVLPSDTGFRLGLAERGLSYAVAVRQTTTACPAEAVPKTLPYTGRGRRPVPRYRQIPVSLKAPSMTRAVREYLHRNSSDSVTMIGRPLPTHHQPARRAETLCPNTVIRLLAP